MRFCRNQNHLMAVAMAIVVCAACGKAKDKQTPEVLPNVILIVLDTLRADSTSLCGYNRPTTPNLTRLANQPDAAYTCGGVTPATWTLPSHASFFTGVGPTVHRTHAVAGKFKKTGKIVRSSTLASKKRSNQKSNVKESK